MTSIADIRIVRLVSQLPWLWIVIGAAICAGCGSSSSPARPSGSPATGSIASADVPLARNAELQRQIAAFCGGCHGFPSPGTFPRDAWYDEVEQGFGFYYTSGRTDLDPPKIQDVVEYYRSQAPAKWRLPPLDTAVSASPVAFRTEIVPLPDGAASPGVSHLRWWTPEEGRPSLLVCDMRAGLVGRVRLRETGTGIEILARVPHPAHVEPTDLDADGRRDFVVADLGSFEPADHDRGRVVWLRQAVPEAPCDVVPLVEGLGRVADVQPADVDGDGDLDLIVAEFGWRSTGHIQLLEQTGRSESDVPRFETRQLDERHGAIHVPIVDLNGDDRLDFVALISQEHEVIEAFLGRGDGAFDKQRIHAAGDPSYGSSGIELVDMDGDGDLDVLYTNGDTLDSMYLKPFHAVQWLENTGSYPFTRHKLAGMPGAYRARAVDLDGDGDRDVVACAIFSHRGRQPLETADRPLYSLVWLEQAAPGRFVQHPLLTMDEMGFMTLEVGDFDGDGRIDIAAGQFASPTQSGDGWITVWWNEGPR